jgi:hypothetical protein
MATQYAFPGSSDVRVFAPGTFAPAGKYASHAWLAVSHP